MYTQELYIYLSIMGTYTIPAHGLRYICIKVNCAHVDVTPRHTEFVKKVEIKK